MLILLAVTLLVVTLFPVDIRSGTACPGEGKEFKFSEVVLAMLGSSSIFMTPSHTGLYSTLDGSLQRTAKVYNIT